jgi:hypothetical protein
MAIAFIVVAMSILTLLLFVYVWTAKSKIRSYALNISISVFTVLYLFVVLEIIFYNFFVCSDGFGFTLSSKRWFSKYWKPINSYEYRDSEHVHVQGRKILFVVGDSIAAGHGIEAYSDRFSNVLARKLDERWEVINIAQNGWDTNNEFEAIVSYPHKPDMIILAYFINDIEGAAKKVGVNRPVLIKNLPPLILASLIDYSYCANYFYWRIHRYNFAEALVDRYREYLFQAYASKKIWEVHQKELMSIIEFTKENMSELIVIVFPDFSNIAQSKKFTSKIVDFMKKNDVRVIDMASRLTGRKAMDLVVSAIDAHPNEAVHREIAEILYETVSKGKALLH